MNFVQDFETLSSLSRNSMKMIDPSSYEGMRDSKSPPRHFDSTSYSEASSQNQFDYLMQEVDNVDTIANETGGAAAAMAGKCEEEETGTTAASISLSSRVAAAAYMTNPNILQQQQQQQLMASMNYPGNIGSLLNTNSATSYFTLRRQSRSNSLVGASINSNSNIIGVLGSGNNVGYFLDRGIKFSNEFSGSSNINKFQYVLMAPTSPGVKINEDTLTYMNQGQNYELRFSRTDLAAMQP